MYTARHFGFEEKDITEIEQLIHDFGFATLVSVQDGRPVATHLPLQLEKKENGEWILHGHIARANPQWKGFKTEDKILAIFMGPHAYISPSWYNHKNVPTWNYRAVHLYGSIRITEGEELHNNLRKLMARYETAHAKSPIKFDEVPQDILQGDLKALIGFEIKVERIEAVSKLSQNRDAESYQSIISHLNESDSYDSKRIAEEMEKRKNDLKK